MQSNFVKMNFNDYQDFFILTIAHINSNKEEIVYLGECFKKNYNTVT